MIQKIVSRIHSRIYSTSDVRETSMPQRPSTMGLEILRKRDLQRHPAKDAHSEEFPGCQFQRHYCVGKASEPEA